MARRITDGAIEDVAPGDEMVGLDEHGNITGWRQEISQGVAHVEKKYPKRTDRERADQVAGVFGNMLMGKASLLRRPIDLEDLTEQERNAYGYALAEQGRKGKHLTWPPAHEELKRVAVKYLRAQGRIGQRFTA